MSKYAAFFAAHKASVAAGNTLTREEQIAAFTEGRTTSLKDLTPDELAQLVAHLGKATRHPDQADAAAKADKMRKAIISIFRQMGKTVKEAIAWAEGQGVAGVKRRFNDYSNQELHTLIRVAEKIQADQRTAVRKALARDL